MKQYVPFHGRNVEHGGWDSIQVYTLAPGFGAGFWIRELGRETKRPDETLEALRARLARAMGRKPEELVLEGVGS